MKKLPLIAIVDDDDSVRESLRGLMRAVGFGVAVFPSGETFLSSENLHNIDCLILDIRMPGMDGFELKRRLAARQYGIPVIFITAHGDEEARLKALKAGAVGYLLKPFSEEELLSTVQEALNNKT
jgi:FixJ family two-component response regulator